MGKIITNMLIWLNNFVFIPKVDRK